MTRLRSSSRRSKVDVHGTVEFKIPLTFTVRCCCNAVSNGGVECRWGMKKCFFCGQYLASSRVVNAATVRCYKHSAAGPYRGKLVTLIGGLCVQHLSEARVTVLYYVHLLPLDAMQIGSYTMEF